MESKNVDNLKSNESNDNTLDEDELIKKSKSLMRIVENLQNRIKKAITGVQELEDKEKCEKKEVEITQNEYLKEISEKLDELFKAIEENNNSRIEETLNQILEKVNFLVDKNMENTSKLDRILQEIDNIISKLEELSEKIVVLYENGSMTVLDIVKLVREIYTDIHEIREIVSAYRYEEIDRAIEIVDNLNDKIDIYLKEFEKIINECIEECVSA